MADERPHTHSLGLAHRRTRRCITRLLQNSRANAEAGPAPRPTSNAICIRTCALCTEPPSSAAARKARDPARRRRLPPAALPHAPIRAGPRRGAAAAPDAVVTIVNLRTRHAARHATCTNRRGFMRTGRVSGRPPPPRGGPNHTPPPPPPLQVSHVSHRPISGAAGAPLTL
ncbi:MAG: hypothetical protein J3K34DRAFT_423536 [Monoraphidium minutum]|nr:MAG: hypothetical protein J3K34DRAFT_423536 [Monoraphidium minutum]